MIDLRPAPKGSAHSIGVSHTALAAAVSAGLLIHMSWENLILWAGLGAIAGVGAAAKLRRPPSETVVDGVLGAVLVGSLVERLSVGSLGTAAAALAGGVALVVLFDRLRAT
jgi:hypothetical protein